MLMVVAIMGFQPMFITWWANNMWTWTATHRPCPQISQDVSFTKRSKLTIITLEGLMPAISITWFLQKKKIENVKG